MVQRKFVKIAEFCDTGSGTTPSRQKLEAYYGGGIPWVKSGELREGVITKTEESVTELALKETSLRLVPSGALLVAMYGATVGRVGRLGIEATTNQAVCHIVPDQLVADQQYMFHALCAKASELVAKGVGGAQPNISQGTIKETEIYLPPLEEQKRIAAILDQAEDIRRKRQHAIDRLNQLGQAIFYEMFGDPASNPMGWPVRNFGALGDLDRGISKHRPRNDPALLGGIHPLIQTGDIANADGYIRSYKSTYSDLGLKQSRKWPVGTLCITIAANIGKTAILDIETCFPDSVVGFLPSKDVNAEYIQFWMRQIQQRLEEVAPQSAQKNINLAILRNLPVPVPPKRDQDNFKSILLEIENDKSNQLTYLDEAESLFASLQYRAFTGQL